MRKSILFTLGLLTVALAGATAEANGPAFHRPVLHAATAPVRFVGRVGVAFFRPPVVVPVGRPVGFVGVGSYGFTGYRRVGVAGVYGSGYAVPVGVGYGYAAPVGVGYGVAYAAPVALPAAYNQQPVQLPAAAPCASTATTYTEQVVEQPPPVVRLRTVTTYTTQQPVQLPAAQPCQQPVSTFRGGCGAASGYAGGHVGY